MAFVSKMQAKRGSSQSLKQLGSLFTLLLFLTFFMPVAYGQIYTSNIVGTVTDTSGAVIPGASVALVNVNTGVKDQTKTNGVGDYTFQYLHPGQFTLTVEAKGFRKLIRENITLQMYSKLSINVTLQPGAVTQSVTVKAATPLLQTQTGEQAVTLPNRQVDELPVTRVQNVNGSTNVIDSFKLLSPGIVQDTSGTWTVSEGGIVRKDQDYIDGAMSTQTVWQGNAITPVPDAIQEIKVMTNSFSAVYGETGGSITLVSTKSGTNHFHGDLYEYLQNNDLNASEYFSHQVPKEAFNNFGFTLGGPIKKNKLFFFVDAAWTKDVGATAFTGLTVPDPSWRNGDFTNVLGAQVGTDALGRPIYKNEIFNYSTQRAVTAGQVDPVTGLVATQTGYVRDPYTPMNIIPQADLNASALLLQKLYPLPTASGAIFNNYTTVQPATNPEHQYDIKIDYYARPQDKIMGRWSASWGIRFAGQPFPGIAGGGLRPISQTSQAPVLDWVHTFGPATTNDVHASYFHVANSEFPEGYGTVGLSTYGITGLPNANQPLGVPNIGGNPNGFLGSSGVWFLGSRYDTLFVQGMADIFINDLVTHIQGKHTLQFGGEIQRMQTNNNQPQPANTRWYFSNDFTDQYTGTGVGSTGFDYASFLVGLPSNLQYQAFPNYADVRASVYSLFAEDTYRVKPNLTLDLGLRWDAPTYWYGVNNTVGSIYSWNGTSADYHKLGVNGFRQTQWNNRYWNFGPRIGIAWSPSFVRNTVFRAGYGLFKIGVQGGGAHGGFPLDPGWLTVSDNGIFNDGLTAALTEPRGLTLSNIPYTPFVASLNPNPGITPNNNPLQTVEQWNVGIEHEVGGIMFDVAYAGAHDYHLQQNGYSPNVIPPNLLSACQGKKFTASGTQCVPYPQYSIGALGQSIWIGENNYNSLQITATKHFSNGLSFMGAYTWAKNLNVGENGFRFPVADRYADRAWDSNSVPQRFTLAYVYALPFGNGNHWLTSGPFVPIVGNWQVSGITTLQSGFPLTVSGANTCPGCGNSANQPDMIGNPVPSGFTQNTAHWFDPNAFKEPALWTVGNAGYNGLFFGPGYSNFDISVAKRFYFPKLGESRNLQFRADFLNAFNHPWFSNPNTNIQSATAGEITSVQNSPRVIQLALKFYF